MARRNLPRGIRIRTERLIWLPLVGSGLRKSQVCEDSVNELARHLGGVLGMVIERRYDGKDGRSSVGCELHVS